MSKTNLIPKLSKFFLAGVLLISMSVAFAANITVPMNFTAANGVGKPAGTITITETKYGLLFTPNLYGLVPGAHGFHIHQYPSCDKNGMAAGGHFDPKATNKHLGPYNDNGHLGDLPLLYVNPEGKATSPVLAPRLHHISRIAHHSLMIHESGDNYSDIPEKLGGGGGRMVCGVIN